MSKAFQLCASMYIPCVHPELKAIFSGDKYPGVRSLIACTEDAIRPESVKSAIASLAAIVRILPPMGVGPLRFIRCRNPQVLEDILAIEGIDKIDGFVLPKIDESVLPVYETALRDTAHYVMPTLETIGVFDPLWQRDMRYSLLQSCLRDRVLALRIGGNDLLKYLGLRRIRGITAYETPLGALIGQLILSFRPYGFHLTAPVYDFVDDPDTLQREIRQDVRMGLIGKTAIHPSQAPIIDSALRVSRGDLEAARIILDSRGSDAAVFKHRGAMQESMVHAAWAQQTIERAAVAGTV